MQRHPSEVDLGYIGTSMLVIPLVSARKALVPQFIVVVSIISGNF